MRKLKKILLKAILYMSVYAMWTSMLVYGFMHITVYK